MAAGKTSSRSRIDAPLRYWGLGSIPVRKPLLLGFGCREQFCEEPPQKVVFSLLGQLGDHVAEP
jgi:hypothetical protein